MIELLTRLAIFSPKILITSALLNLFTVSTIKNIFLIILILFLEYQEKNYNILNKVN